MVRPFGFGLKKLADKLVLQRLPLCEGDAVRIAMGRVSLGSHQGLSCDNDSCRLHDDRRPVG